MPKGIRVRLSPTPAPQSVEGARDRAQPVTGVEVTLETRGKASRMKRDLSLLWLVLSVLACQRAEPVRAAAPAPIAKPPLPVSASPEVVNASAVGAATSGESPDGGPLVIRRFLGPGCGLDDAGKAQCWVSPTATITDRDADVLPQPAPELDDALAFVKSAYFSYVLRQDGQVYVWGREPHSYLGDISRPIAMPGLSGVEQIMADGRMVYALQREGTMLGWSDSFMSDEPGEPGVVDSDRPVRVASGVSALAKGHYIARDGTVYAGTFPPVTRVDALKSSRSVSYCVRYACSLQGGSSAPCWKAHPPQAFRLEAPAQLVSLGCAGAGNLYALLADGSVMVDQEAYPPPRLQHIPTLEQVAELGLCRGELACPHCVKLKNGTVSCWGEGSERRLGSGQWPMTARFVQLEKGRDVTTPRR